MALEPLDGVHQRGQPWPHVEPACKADGELWPCRAVQILARDRAIARLRAAAADQREIAELLCEAINSVSELGPREFIRRLTAKEMP